MPDIRETVPASDRFARDSSTLKPPRGWLPVAAAVAATAALAAIVWRSRTGRPAPDLEVVRCPIHGIAYDAKLEMCPECAKPASADIGRPGTL